MRLQRTQDILSQKGGEEMSKPLIEVKDLKVYFKQKSPEASVL